MKLPLIKRLVCVLTILVQLSLCHLITACGNEEISLHTVSDQTHGIPSTHISEIEAKHISDNFLYPKSTRAFPPEISGIEYVLTDSKTRSVGVDNDTLAYVFNYVGKGFTIIAADRRLWPIIGYSHDNNFSHDNPISYAEVIENIPDYINSQICNYSQGNSNFDTDSLQYCAAVAPIIQGQFHQGNPFNKYVKEAHPFLGDPPVGCVALATAMVMLHSAQSVVYHGVKRELKLMLDGFKKGNKSNAPARITGGGVTPPYTYDQATDSIAKLLYWIGIDEGIEYGSAASGGNAEKAYELLTSLGFNCSAYLKYDISDMIEKLVAQHIIYVTGYTHSKFIKPDGEEGWKTSGHAWVVDGCQYCLENGEIKNPSIHCDWGWAGLSNGYFTPELFSTKSKKPYPTISRYFAVKLQPNVNL